MRGRRETGDDFPEFPIVPILVYYGGADVPEGYGERAYKCPFHKDSDASASVNTTKQLFNCHANGDCPTGGAVAIIMHREGIDYASAVERAADISGAGNAPVRRESGRRGRMAGGARSRDGVRSFKRTWRSP